MGGPPSGEVWAGYRVFLDLVRGGKNDSPERKMIRHTSGLGSVFDKPCNCPVRFKHEEDKAVMT